MLVLSGFIPPCNTNRSKKNLPASAARKPKDTPALATRISRDTTVTAAFTSVWFAAHKAKSEVGASLLQTSSGCRSGTAFPVARNHTPGCNVESFIYLLMRCSFVLLVWSNISRNNFQLELSLASDRLQRGPLVHQANVESLLEGPVFFCIG